MRSLWVNKEKVRNRIVAENKIMLLLDFDGTLSPLVRQPQRARLPRNVRRGLLKLNSSPTIHIAVISGRPLNILRKVMGIKTLFYGGNHGLEISGPGVHWVNPKAVKILPVMQSLADQLTPVMDSVSGALLDNKGLSLSLHYRQVSAARRPSFQQLIRLWRRKTRDLPLRWLRGHMVWEVLPRVEWNKGRAAHYLGRLLHRPYSIAIGDDRTDEDMFHSIRQKGVSIRIGRSSSSCAQYFLKGQNEVPRILEWIARLRLGSLS